MTEENIFDTVSVDPVETEESTSPLDDLVGEGKKFASVEDLAKGKIESDRFISRLQSEMEELRKEVSKQLTLEEIMTQIRESTNRNNEHHTEQPTPSPETPTDTFSPEKIEEYVRSTLTKAQQEERSSRNEKEVTEKLAERYGSDAQIFINKKAKELGVSTSYLRETARDNPAVFYRLVQFDTDPRTPPSTPAPRSSHSISPSSGNRDKAYYDKMKATDRKKYFSSENQLQMYKDMEKVLSSGGTWA